VKATKPGDIWALGAHRLVCGDATDAKAVRLALKGHAPRLMVTDPPYGVSYEPEWRVDGPVGVGYGDHKATAVGRIANDHTADWSSAFALFPGNVAYVWCASLRASTVEATLVQAGFVIRNQIIWDKRQLIVSRGHYHWRHEPCWYAVRKGRTANWTGDRRQTTVWEAMKRKNASGHPNEKPLLCMQRPIENHTRRGDAVYDPFLGSGTTLIAAEMAGRVCLGLELNPAYCDIIVKRWSELTGKRARLIRD
jgi:DNA modification methylase